MRRAEGVLVLSAIAAGVVLLALEGAIFADLPGALVHILYLPALYAPSHVPAWLLAVGLMEWGLGRIPPGAVFSTAATAGLAYYALREDVNTESPWLAAIILPALEVLRQLWTSLYASLYEVPPPPMPWAHLPTEAVAGTLIVAWLIHHRGNRGDVGLVRGERRI